MFKNDYIMRIIQQFVEAVAKVVFNKKKKKLEEARQLAGESLRSLTGLGPDLLDALPLPEILRLVEVDGAMDADRGMILAALLDESADLSPNQAGPASGARRRAIALHLYMAIRAAGRPCVMPERFERIPLLLEELDPGSLARRTLVLLAGYHESEGDYGKAEDVWFDLIEAQPDSQGDLEGAAAFYRRLLSKDDGDLAGGNLPRTEVEEGLREIERRLDEARSP